MLKVKTKKLSFMPFDVFMIKPLRSSKRLDWLFIKKKSWICVMTHVKRISIFEINKVICHCLYKDNERKRDQ
jgi:hypothetical protein